MARIEDKRSFKAINFDDADEYLDEGDTRLMLNVRVGYSENGNDGTITNVKGTISLFSELNFSLPAGTNKCIATCPDDQNSRLIWLNYNSNNNHGIYCYNLETNTIQTILASARLNFSDEIIHSIDILNGNLAWVDDNRPRAINVARGIAGTYAGAAIEELINDAKVVPMYPPTCTTTNTFGSDYIQSLKSFQFIYRYVFLDGEKGAWSTVSKLVPTAYRENRIEKITLDVSDCELFTKTSLRNIIEFVEFASRELYTLNFNQFLRITTTELVADAGIVEYFDTESKTPVDTEETNIAFYENPIKAGSVCFQNDRKFYADCTEGYDAFNLSPSLSNINIQVIPSSGGIPYLSDCGTHVSDRYLKPDSEYSYSIEFHDKYGRKSGAADLPDLVIKTQEQLSNDYKANVLQFGLNLSSVGSYPAWAEKFEIIRSDNKTVTFFAQGRVDRVLYCTGYDANDDPTYVNAGANATSQNVSDTGAIELHIDIGNWSQYSTNIGYTYSEGDRVTFFTMGGINDDNGTAVFKGLKIKELRGDLLIVDYPQAGRTNLNHAMIASTATLFDVPPITSISGIISRFIVGDNGVALYSRIERLTAFQIDPNPISLFPLTYPFPYTGLAQMTYFPVVSNNLYGVSVYYQSVFNTDTINVFIVGSEGFFIRGIFQPVSNTFSTTWTTITTGVATDINCIESSFSDHTKTDLVLVGDAGKMFRYNIAGGTLVPLISGTTENLNHVYREGTSSTLIAVGDNGTILRTTNNGDSWTQIAIDNCQNLNGVYARGIYAIAVGDEGLVVQSNDLGVTWEQRGASTVSNLNSVEGDGTLESDTMAYIAGENGFLVRWSLLDRQVNNTYNTGTAKNINHFQSYELSTGVYDYGITVGDLDLLQDVSVPALTFTDYSASVSVLYGSIYLNYRAKIEVYSPKTTSGPVIFYETGDAYPVGANYTFNKGKESDGDVYLIKKDFRGAGWTMVGDTVFSMTPDSNNTTGPWDKDLGRPNTVLLYPEKQQRRNIIRFSEKYVQDSKINGLSNFVAANYEPIPNEFGYIRKITPVESVLLINAERETATAYIDQTVFRGTDGRDVAATSDIVINNVRKLAGGFGCMKPESIVKYLDSVYFYTTNKGGVCRYNNANGVFPISEYKARTYFYRINTYVDSNTKLIGGFEPRFKNYLLTAKDLTSLDFETVEEEFPGATEEYTIVNTSTPLSLTPSQQTIAQVPGGNIYMGASGSNVISIINKDTDLVVGSIDISTISKGLIYCPFNGKIYACGASSVVCINPTTNTVEATVSIGSNNFFMAFCPNNNYIYVSDPDTNNIHVISAISNSFVTDIALPFSGAGDPIQIMYIADVVKIYCLDPNATPCKLYCIDPLTNTIDISITLPNDSIRLTYATTNRKLYVVSRGLSTVTVISVDTNTSVNSITGIGGNSFWPAYGNGFVYVPSQTAGRVYIIDTATDLVVSNVVCGTGTRFCVYNENDGNVYCSNSGTNSVTIINSVGNTLVTSVTSGTEPQYPFIGDNSKTYVPNATTNSISVIETAFVFDETIAFQEGSNRWISKYSFVPERYGYVNIEMFSFKDGVLWKHNASDTHNNFYGVQYTSKVNPVFTKGATDQKNYTYMSLDADKVWSANPITTPEGQETFILSGHFEKIQNEWFADIKQDINTPNMPSTDEALINGDFIQSNVLDVLLESQASDQTKLKFATVYSNKINKGFSV